MACSGGEGVHLLRAADPLDLLRREHAPRRPARRGDPALPGDGRGTGLAGRGRRHERCLIIETRAGKSQTARGAKPPRLAGVSDRRASVLPVPAPVRDAHRRAPRPRRGPAGRGHGPVRVPRGRPRREDPRARLRGEGPRRPAGQDPGDAGPGRLRAEVPEGDQGGLRARSATACRDLVAKGSVPIVLGGDHSIAMGTHRRACRSHFHRAQGEDRAHLDRRPRRLQHRGDEPERQHPRHAARRRPGPGAAEPGEPRRLLADGRRLARRPRRPSATWTPRSVRTSRPRASAPSPCATSTSAGCGR